MIEKLVLGGTWTRDLPIFSPDALTSAPSRQAEFLSLLLFLSIFLSLMQSIQHMKHKTAFHVWITDAISV